MMKALSLAVLLIVSLAVACGGDDGGSGGSPANDEAAIRKVISDFGKAFNDGKAGDMIKLMDAESRKNCNEKDLAAILALVKTFSGGGKFGVETKSVRVNGDKATAVVVPTIGNEKQDEETNELVKEDGKWKIAFGAGDCDL
jgi:hypothetical protein